MIRLATIVSTADAGAARGALEGAIELELGAGGWTAAEDLPAIFAERTKRTVSPRMAARLNVQDSDGTLIVSFRSDLAPGTPVAYVDQAIEQQRKPALHVVLPAGERSRVTEDLRKGVVAWLAEEKINTLHVTGPREVDEPGIQQATRDALVWLLEDELAPAIGAAPQPAAGG
ncbi:MAG: YpsA SLOG family protein [Mycobacteriales bacterium]|nr:putative molybdenum carrier protein [Actinomycetota bacterium]